MRILRLREGVNILVVKQLRKIAFRVFPPAISVLMKASYFIF